MRQTRGGGRCDGAARRRIGADTQAGPIPDRTCATAPEDGGGGDEGGGRAD
jgi:hypothetical protein